jgi:hypothetical protein
MKLKVLSVLLASAVLLAPAAHAQFGSGIVYDPTQGAHAIQQIQQGESQLQKWATELNNWQQHLLKEAQIYTTAVQTRTQIVTMYNLAYQMSTMPQNRLRGIRQTLHSGRAWQLHPAPMAPIPPW